MRSIPRNISLLAVSVMTLSMVAVTPAFAAEQEDGNTTTISASEGSDSQTSTGSHRVIGSPIPQDDSEQQATEASSTSTKTETEQDRVNSLRSKAQQLLQQYRQGKKASTVADRQKACQAHEAELTTREANYAKAGQNHLDTFTSIYNKVLAFQDKNKLSVSGYADLKAKADAAQATAQADVTALSGTDVQIDCTSQDPAASVAALKTAVANAREALQEYRTAINNLVVALLAAQPASSSTSGSTSGTDSSTSTNTGSNQ